MVRKNKKQLDKRDVVKKIKLDDTGFENLEDSYHYFAKGTVNLFPLGVKETKTFEDECELV